MITIALNIVCNDGVAKGNSYILNKNSIFVISGYLDESDQRDARKLCAYDKINIGYDETRYPDPVLTNYTYVPLYKTIGSWWDVIKNTFIGLVGVPLVFWLIRGIFYYVALGNFKGSSQD